MNREKRFPPFLAFVVLALLVKHKARHHCAHHSHHHHRQWKHHCQHWHSCCHDHQPEAPQEYV